MKSWINIIIYIVLTATIAVMGAVINGNKKHVSAIKNQVVTLNNQVEEQAAIIDSLLKRRMTVFDVKLIVTDKSVNKINGSHNKGTISMPQERVYKLEIDSTKITVK